MSYPESLHGTSEDLLIGNAKASKGWQITDRKLVLGYGEECFQIAVQQLFSWKAHQYAGITVTQTNTTVELKFWSIRSYCRVLKSHQGSRRAILIYGTLEKHVERGEEAFEITMADNDQVTAHIVAFSKPAKWWAKLANPVVRWVQLRITDKYLEGLKS
ncbi:hypothetical protein YH66_08175 [[Brevibacterium] flavum]|uniref:DUF1990 domain-containing protein n=1 Tax=[Brevibacterium] flavum TaxID=92706 RepID=A0A0F6WQR8_9CORY|nr:hypothetical protein YH66_08175 [[Brevibacterium] flavum]KEI23270.1 hypothetical protein KIQ_012085 [Corynebacterium glutamicum ATCC 14067]OKX93527.1 hypothetical protein AUP71_10405 [Corynebacterium glutamicum]QJS17684.1 DUF1990 family protein [Corynebacterium glutamicum]QXU47279.1 DUF1990 family protein [[Brevibacterium] flavum]